MTGASYIPGRWLGIVRSQTAVLLGPEAPAELAGALWELLAGRPEPHEVLAAVTSSSGGSLTRIPSFGILDFNGSLRVFLRGDIDLRVEQPGGAVDLDGRDVTTWNERKFAVPGTCRLGIEDGSIGSTDAAGGTGGAAAPELPLGEGVVLLSSLTFGARSGPAAVDAPAVINGPAVVDAPAPVDAPAAVSVSAPVFVAAAHEAESGHTPTAPDGPFAVNAAGKVNGTGDLDSVAETVVGVIDGDPDEDVNDDLSDDMDEDLDGERSESGDLNPAFDADGLDPDATIAPGTIIGADEELMVEPGGLEPAGAEPSGPETDAGEAAPAVELTSSYDHLWDRTVMRNIEDAAVREEPDADSGHVVQQQPPALPAPGPLPALDAPEDAAKDAGAHDPAAGSGAATDPGTGAGSDDSAATGTDDAAAASTPPRPAPTGLIDSVPWRTGGTATGGTASQPAAPAPPPEPTLGTPPAPAGQEPFASAAGAASPAQGTNPAHPGTGFDPDHDGQTVMKSSLPGAGSGPAAPVTAQQNGGDGPLVLARVCGQGHANPPTRAQCSACGGALLPDAAQVARPRLGRMRLSTGELLDLDQSMVIGRQPSVSRVQGGVMPRLVQVASPGGDISRSHVEVRLEGWHVMLCDLKATNGTVLVREGQPPRRLAQNEMAILLDGDIAELGDNISLRFEEIP
ncbi:hypothetical protein QF031_002705 [Pseudarthrobacter defluvii]|uniref:FHA domain-containing protein n=1 Tax=Pseudarthrobacter defluvii TaxID=410837 RepID=UPI00278B2DE3|nr:FHA domain-containing protein [Pseudarthrobacter defluvii]MDQ0769956.1 hypothetical protein [Pseudarthrobacter defluvii]